MYVSRLGIQLFRALRANVAITCVDVTLRNVTGRAHEKARNGRIMEGEDADLGHCSKCEMVQCLDGGLMAKLMIASASEKLSLCAFGKIVENIAC